MIHRNEALRIAANHGLVFRSIKGLLYSLEGVDTFKVDRTGRLSLTVAQFEDICITAEMEREHQ